MPKPHEGHVELNHSFVDVYTWLTQNGPVNLTTRVGTAYEAKVGITQGGDHSGEKNIRFFQGRKEYGRAYDCCWGYYHNCNRTRIGMYCVALDNAIG